MKITFENEEEKLKFIKSVSTGNSEFKHCPDEYGLSRRNCCESGICYRCWKNTLENKMEIEIKLKNGL